MDLTKITTPFGLLDAETKQALRGCGGPWEFWQYRDMWGSVDDPTWHDNLVYRQKPQPLTQDSIPWAQIDKRFKWAARDEDGEWFLYELKPEKRNFCWGDYAGDYIRADNIFADYRPGTCDWRDSLQQRPEGV